MIGALELTDSVLIVSAALAVIGWSLAKLADLKGWTQSSGLVRQENSDLRERNATLDGEVKALRGQVESLQRQVDDLKARSVEVLWTEMTAHETRAADRHQSLLAVLQSIAAALTTTTPTPKEA